MDLKLALERRRRFLKNGMTDGEKKEKGERKKREGERQETESQKKRKEGRRGDTRSTDGFTSNEGGGSSCYPDRQTAGREIMDRKTNVLLIPRERRRKEELP